MDFYQNIGNGKCLYEVTFETFFILLIAIVISPHIPIAQYVPSVNIIEYFVILQNVVIVFGIYLISLPLWGWKLIIVIKRNPNGEVMLCQKMWLEICNKHH